MASAKSGGAPLSSSAGAMSDTSSIQSEGGAVSRHAKRASVPRRMAAAATDKSAALDRRSGSKGGARGETPGEEQEGRAGKPPGRDRRVNAEEAEKESGKEPGRIRVGQDQG